MSSRLRGTVYRRKDWYGIAYTDPSGRRIRKKIGPDRRLAERALAKRLGEIAEGIEFPRQAANQLPFSELADRYWELHGRNLRSRSWKCIVNQAKKHFGRKPIGSITAADIESYRNKIKDKTSPATSNRHLTFLKSLYRLARGWRLFYGENPCQDVRALRERNERLRFFDQEEMTNLLAACHKRIRPVVLTALLSGMRQGEILSLRWEDLDLERGLVGVLETKSGKPRHIKMGTRLREVFIGLKPKKHGPVFRVPLITLRRLYAKALKKANIKGATFHTTRHSFASHYIMRTSDLPGLQMILGHSTPKLTMRYAHLSEGHMAANMAIFESAIPGGKTNISENSWHQDSTGAKVEGPVNAEKGS